MQTIAPVRTYTIDALLAEGFSLRQIRRFRRNGILPPAVGRGPYAYYTGIHLAILREIRRAKDDRRTLDDLADWSQMTYPHAFAKANA